MEDAKVLVTYWQAKGHGAVKIYQKLSMRSDRAYPADSTITD
jgi:hypothetical protein